MKDKAVSAQDLGRLIRGISAEFFHVAHELAMRRAARDAHRSECDAEASECAICRMHAACIAEAKAALRRDTFS